MQKIHEVLCSWLAVLIILNAYAICPGQSGPGSVEITYKIKSPTVTLKEPVVLQFEATNQTGSPIQFDLGFNRVENFIVTFNGPQRTKGEHLQVSGSGFGRSGDITLAPQKTYTQALLLNRWIKFKIPGVYQVEVHLAKPPHNLQGGLVGGIDDFHGTVEVLAEDPAQLARTCEFLARLVEGASSVADADLPAMSLSFVDDPIAVPYLERVIHARGIGALYGGVAVQGLARIGNDAAIRALISALDLSDLPTTSISAERTLMQIERETDDPFRKTIIQDTLSKYEIKDGRLQRNPAKKPPSSHSGQFLHLKSILSRQSD